MTHLTCNATDCASNKNNCCCRPSIKVQGPCAEACCDTQCQSFCPNEPGCSNAADFSSPNPELNIKCSASHCVHYCNGCCDAESVHINGAGAQTLSETECSSFSAR